MVAVGKPSRFAAATALYRVGAAQPSRMGDRFKFRIQAAVKKDEEAEACGLHGGAMSGPRVGRFSGRIVQPEAGVGEGLMQSREVCIAGIDVAIETEIGRALSRRQLQRELRQSELGD